MDLLEYQGKQLFARHGVPVPAGKPASTVQDAVVAADEIGYPCAVKAQVQIGGRGKLGGIKIAQNRAEAEQHAAAILGMDIRGLTVHEVWIEGASEIASEYYASVVFDRSAKAPLVMLSTKGGMDIEQVADDDPDAIATLHVDPLLGFQDFHGRRLAFEAGVDADVVRPVGAMLAQAVRGVHRRGGDAGRGQPADRHPGPRRCARSTRRSRSTTTRSTAIPTTRPCATCRPRIRRR